MDYYENEENITNLWKPLAKIEINLKMNTHNIMVGNSLILNVCATLVNREQLTRPTIIGVAWRDCATLLQIGSKSLQSVNLVVYI